MPYSSRWHLDIPRSSLPTLILKSPDEPLDDERACFLDAGSPEKHHLTTSTYRLWCQRFALGLQRSGSFEKGDRVLLFSGNDLFYPVVFLGVIMAGGIFTGANPTFVARELAHQLKDSSAKYLLCAESSLETAIEAAKLMGMPEEHLFIYDGVRSHDSVSSRKPMAANLRSWEVLLADGDDAKKFQWDDLRWPQDAWHRTLALNYSSGTTGHPKGVEITHANYVSSLVQYLDLSSQRPDYDAENRRARWLNFLPLYHAMSQVIHIGMALLRGIPVYVMPKFDFIQMLEYVQKYRITHLTLAPPIVLALAKHPIVKKYDLSSVETAASGAAPLGFQSMLEFNHLWPDSHMSLTQGWGMTELTCTVLARDPKDTSTSNMVGELLPKCEAMIVAQDSDDNDNNNNKSSVQQERREIVARGPTARGELWIRGPNVMKGYWRNPEATRQMLTADGWLKTGDIAYIDDDGRNFFIVDRKKEMIKVKGHQVAPAELEAVLLDHPAVADAAVIGHRSPGDDRQEERPRAYIVLRPDSDPNPNLTSPSPPPITPTAIADFLAARVTAYKRLTGGVVFVDAIPKNPSGKILRKVLRDGVSGARTSRPRL